jgi:hypothetical protein
VLRPGNDWLSESAWSPRRWLRIGIALLASAAACSDGEGSGGPLVAFPADATCGAALALDGALVLTIPPSRSSTACSSQTSFDSGIDVGFAFVDSELSRVDLAVDDVREGETGSGFPARLEIVHDDEREWRGQACTAEIAEHEHVGPGELGWERYRLNGSVACESAASVGDDAGVTGSSEALELKSFTFVVSLSWG